MCVEEFISYNRYTVQGYMDDVQGEVRVFAKYLEGKQVAYFHEDKTGKTYTGVMKNSKYVQDLIINMIEILKTKKKAT